jgi:mannose-1-phosphate guanylyltransferase/mannose-6-phosphate isomerase
LHSQNNHTTYPVIIAGGVGERLWPLSRTHFPKQFQNIIGEHSLFQQTALRLNVEGFHPPLIICNEEHRFIVAQQLQAIGISPMDIILEPESKNTTPAIAIAAAHINNNVAGSAMLLITPADHYIDKSEAFISQALSLANEPIAKEAIITFGISPHRPETHYGYIKPSNSNHSSLHPVEAFIEKPDLATAEKLLKEGSWHWNAGIFVATAHTLQTAIKEHANEVYDAVEQSLTKASKDLDFIRLEAKAFAQSPNISFDYGVMEKASNIYVSPIAITWNDLGSWNAVKEYFKKDAHGNHTKGDVVTHETSNCCIFSDETLIATSGVSDLNIISFGNATLIANNEANLKALIKEIKVDGFDEYTEKSGTTHRPWGRYQILNQFEKCKVKKITIYPDESISLQKHELRTEHWIVTKGSATVQIGEKTFTLTENQSAYVPQGEIHKIENNQKQNLEIIEVQYGSECIEEDIIRLAYKYQR